MISYSLWLRDWNLRPYWSQMCFMLTSWPCTMRWCVVIRALKTTTQLALPTLSISVSTIWGTFTLVWSWVAWIRSGEETSRAARERSTSWLNRKTDGMAKQKRDGAKVVLPAQGIAAQLWPFLWACLKPKLEDCDSFIRNCFWKSSSITNVCRWSLHIMSCLTVALASSCSWSLISAEGETESKRQLELQPLLQQDNKDSKLAWWLESPIMRKSKTSEQRVSIVLRPHSY